MLGHTRVMVYGPPGGGKSRLAGTSPKALILANNVDEVVSMKDSTAHVWHTPTIVELTEAFEYVRHDGIKEYSWVWLDNGSLWQDQNMDYLMDGVVAAKTHRNRYQPDKPEYGQNQNMLGTWVRNMVALPINFGICAHVMQKEDPLSDKQTFLPLFQGGQGDFSQKLCGWMNVVMYLDARQKEGKPQRIGYFHKQGKIYAKDRFGKMPARMLEPTIPKIERLIKNG